MFAKASALLALAAAASPALATIYVTSPVASTSWTAGTQQTITWEDDGTSPSLSEFGTASVGVYVGSQISQVLVQSLTASVNVSTTSSIAFTPDASVGENGEYYFIRFDSLVLKDSTNSAYPAQAFSSKYTMSGMTGTFNSTVQAVISSASSSTGAATSASTTKAETTTSKASTTAKSSSASASATGASDTSGAASVPVGMFSCAAGVAAVVFSAMFM